jgi:hypothetical protein
VGRLPLTLIKAESAHGRMHARRERAPVSGSQLVQPSHSGEPPILKGGVAEPSPGSPGQAVHACCFHLPTYLTLPPTLPYPTLCCAK